MAKLLGGIEVDIITDLKKAPQKVASAKSALESVEICGSGAGYNPLIYLGKQIVKGVNYYFIAEQTLMTRNLGKHIVIVSVNEFQGEYKIDLSNIIRIV